MQLKEYWAFVMSNDGHAINLIGLHCETEEHAMERDDREVEAFIANHPNPLTREELLRRLDHR